MLKRTRYGTVSSCTWCTCMYTLSIHVQRRCCSPCRDFPCPSWIPPPCHAPFLLPAPAARALTSTAAWLAVAVVPFPRAPAGAGPGLSQKFLLAFSRSFPRPDFGAAAWAVAAVVAARAVVAVARTRTLSIGLSSQWNLG